MSRPLPADGNYTNRSPRVCILNCTIDREARAILEELAPTRKSYGDFVSRLLHQEKARRQEVQRLRQLLAEEEDPRG